MDRRAALAALTAPGEPYELEEVELYGRPCRAFLRAPPTLRDLFEQSRSSLPFIVYEDERLSFEEAWAEACRIGALLVERYGIEKGDRVAISMRNYPEWMLAFMAVTSVGGIAVAMNALWQPDELAYGLSDSGAKVFFADCSRCARRGPLAWTPIPSTPSWRRSRLDPCRTSSSIPTTMPPSSTRRARRGIPKGRSPATGT
jgi:long-chain acyl-CoA synthetase